MKPAKCLLVIGLGILFGAQASAQDGARQACPAWKPTGEQLQRILSDHSRWATAWENEDFTREWATENPQGRANLCHADLRGADLNKADLRGAELGDADLRFAELNEANLSWANLNKANLNGARLKKAVLVLAELNEANLSGADLNEADLRGAKLNKADLRLAELNKANLLKAEVRDAALAGVELDEAVYAPASPPPDGYVAGIQGLETVRFPLGDEVGLVQLRELLHKAGLRELERQATYAIERGRTRAALSQVRPPANPQSGPNVLSRLATVVEGVFRQIAFDWPVAYGLHPSRALGLIIMLWASLIPVYWWAIWRRPRRVFGPSGIFRIVPGGRVDLRGGEPSLDSWGYVERLHHRGFQSLGWSAYFSLLSAFRIGFREFSVGNWITGVQPHTFTLEPRGWVRSVSGLQSLLSFYLMAMWALTYFGRPFQ